MRIDYKTEANNFRFPIYFKINLTEK